MDVEALIETVKRHPQLWDPKTKLYFNRDATKIAWNVVAAECQTDADCAKAKWKNLRDTFRSELKKTPFLYAGDNAYTLSSKWTWFEQMLFLKDVMAPRKFKSETSKYQECPPQFETGPSDGSDISTGASSPPFHPDEKLFIPQIDYEDADTMPPPFPNANVKRRKQCLIDRSAARSLKNLVEKQATTEIYDDCYHFLMSLLPYLRNLSPTSQLRTRIKIEEILLNESEKTLSMKPLSERNENSR